MRANIVIYMEEADRDLGETVPGVNDVDTSGARPEFYILPVSVEQLCDVRVLNNER